MKKLVITNSYYKCIEQLSEYLRGYPSGLDSHNYIFCEEKMTLLIERQVAKNNNCGFNTSVFSMSRYEMNKNMPMGLLSKEGSTILVRKLILENISGLKLFANAKMKNLAPLIYELIAQLKSANISSEEFKKATENVSGTFKDKLSDISFIFSLYEEELKKNGFIDQNNYLSLLPDIILNDKELKNANVFIVGYANFTQQAKFVIKAINAVCNNVTAFLVGGENGFLFTNEATERYVSALNELKIDFETLYHNVKNNATADNIEKYMFTTDVFSTSYKPVESDKIFLYEAENNLEEIEHIALIIKRDVIQKGLRYRDFMVATANVGEYGEIVKSVFKRYDIPLFVDEKIKLSDNILSKLIIEFIEVYRKGYYQKDVINFIKNPLLSKELDYIDRFENFILKKGINRNGFFRTIEEDEQFEKSRSEIIRYTSGLKEKTTAKDFCNIIKKFLDEIKINDSIEDYSSKMSEYGIVEETAILNQALVKTISVLDEIEKLLDSTILNIDEFKSVLLSGLSSAEISVLPQFNDAVFVGGFKECRQVKANTLFVIGLNSDIPTAKSDIALLNDSDIDKLSELKVAIEPKIRIVNKREKENLGLTMTSFSDRLYLSYSELTSKGKTAKKSEIFLNIEKMFTYMGRPVAFMNKIILENYLDSLPEEKRNKIEALDYITAKEGIIKFAESASMFRNSVKKDFAVPSSFYCAISDENKKLLDSILDINDKEIEFIIGNNKDIIIKNNKFSATTIENFYTCPYRNFLEKGLRIEEREDSKVRFIDAGTFVHDVFDNYTKEMKDFMTKEESDTLTEKIAYKIIEEKKYGIFLLSPENHNLLERLIAEAKTYSYKLYTQYSKSDFKFYRSEAKFGVGEEFDAIKFNIDGKKYLLEGKIDRIDKYEDYIRVIDYKTGKVEVKEKSLFVGEKLQLYLYIQAFIEKFRPGGVYYYPIDNSYKKDDSSKKELYGFTLKNQQVLRAGDISINMENPKSDITGSKISIVKDTGEIQYTDSKSLDENGMQSYLDYAYKIALKGAERICEGMIVASPYEGACDYCPFKSICDFEYNTETPRKVKKVNSDTIIKAVMTQEEDK